MHILQMPIHCCMTILKRGDCMAKTANLYTRIDPELKEQAEYILNSLGLPPSSAITMFYKQIVLQQGLPFDVKLGYKEPRDVSSMTQGELNDESEKGYKSVLSGNAKPASKVFESLHKEFNL